MLDETYLNFEYSDDLSMFMRCIKYPYIDPVMHVMYVKNYLLKGADVNQVSGNFIKETPISLAIASENIALVHVMIEFNVEIKAINQAFMMSIYQAITQYKNIDKMTAIVNLLTSHGLSLNEITQNTSLLIMAVKKSDQSLVGMLIDHGAEVNGNIAHTSALKASSVKYNQSMFDYLIAKGADMNQVLWQHTAIEYLVVEGNVKAVEMFVNAGVDFHTRHKTTQGAISLIAFEIAYKKKGEILAMMSQRMLMDELRKIDADDKPNTAYLPHQKSRVRL